VSGGAATSGDAPGVGEVAERVVKGHHEEFELISVSH
jgi:hypothetical protein